MAKPTRYTQDMIDAYIARGDWDKSSVTDLLKRNAEVYPDKEAVVDSKRRLTWSELDRVTDRVAFGLIERGMERDRFILAQFPSSVETILLLLACNKAGLPCCISPMTFRHNEIRHLVKTLNPVALAFSTLYRGIDLLGMFREVASDFPERRHFIVTEEEGPGEVITFKQLEQTTLAGKQGEAMLRERAFGPFEVSNISLSSGTTGMPKCIEHTGASSNAAGKGVVQRAKLTKVDIIGNIAPMSGGPGFQNWWGGFQVGAKVCLLERYSPDGALRFAEKEGVTYLSFIPTQLIRILKEADLQSYDLSSLRIVRTGAAAFDSSLAKETEERMNCTVLIAGGSQETYSFAQTSVDDPPEKRLKTLGRPFPGNEISIRDNTGKEVPRGEVGRLFVRGAASSSGYYGDVDATLAVWGELGRGGWYKTGDLAKMDEQGYLILVGREKEIIIRGGQNIYPREIENLLLSHTKVTQAVVIGIPDPVMGERTCACVTLVKGETFDFEEMKAFLAKTGLAVHKLPERLEVMEQFPQLVDGQKIDKISLTRKVMEKLGDS